MMLLVIKLIKLKRAGKFRLFRLSGIKWKQTKKNFRVYVIPLMKQISKVKN
jgi:hypothetical protein